MTWVGRKQRDGEGRVPAARLWRVLVQMIGGAIVGVLVAGALMVFAAPSEAASHEMPPAATHSG